MNTRKDIITAANNNAEIIRKFRDANAVARVALHVKADAAGAEALAAAGFELDHAGGNVYTIRIPKRAAQSPAEYAAAIERGEETRLDRPVAELTRTERHAIRMALIRAGESTLTFDEAPAAKGYRDNCPCYEGAILAREEMADWTM